MMPPAFSVSQQLLLLTQSQIELTQVLDSAIKLLKKDHRLLAKHWIDVSLVLRKHKQQVTNLFSLMPDSEHASLYVEKLNALRRDVSTRMTLLSTGMKDQWLNEEFETLCWETLACGVIWLDEMHQTQATEPQQLSRAGEHWDRLRQPQSAPQSIWGDFALDAEIDQIMYSSFAMASMNLDDLEALANNAAQLNRQDRITGMMMHAEGVFVGLIEGSREAVNLLWSRLLRDPNHQGILQLYRHNNVSSRSCANWGLRHVDSDMIRAVLHEVKAEVLQNTETASSSAIERINGLLSNTQWDLLRQER
jgi:Sensors of blue-light using FAD